MEFCTRLKEELIRFIIMTKNSLNILGLGMGMGMGMVNLSESTTHMSFTYTYTFKPRALLQCILHVLRIFNPIAHLFLFHFSQVV